MFGLSTLFYNLLCVEDNTDEEQGCIMMASWSQHIDILQKARDGTLLYLRFLNIPNALGLTEEVMTREEVDAINEFFLVGGHVERFRPSVWQAKNKHLARTLHGDKGGRDEVCFCLEMR